MSIICSAGCGGGTGCDVSGTISVDGQPLETGQVAFEHQSDQSITSVASKIENGNYRIKRDLKMPPGSYKVKITALRKSGRMVQADEGSDEMEEAWESYLPANYNDATELSAEVEKTTKDLNFDLKLDK